MRRRPWFPDDEARDEFKYLLFAWVAAVAVIALYALSICPRVR